MYRGPVIVATAAAGSGRPRSGQNQYANVVPPVVKSAYSKMTSRLVMEHLQAGRRGVARSGTVGRARWVFGLPSQADRSPITPYRVQWNQSGSDGVLQHGLAHHTL